MSQREGLGALKAHCFPVMKTILLQIQPTIVVDQWDWYFAYIHLLYTENQL